MKKKSTIFLMLTAAVLIFSGCKSEPATVEETSAAVSLAETRESSTEEESESLQTEAAVEQYEADSIESLVSILEQQNALTELNVILYNGTEQKGRLLKDGDTCHLGTIDNLYVYSLEDLDNLIFSSQERIVDQQDWLNDNLVRLVFTNFEGETQLGVRIGDNYRINIMLTKDNIAQVDVGLETVQGLSYESWFGSEHYFKSAGESLEPKLIVWDEQLGSGRFLENGEAVKLKDSESLLLYTMALEFTYKSSSNENVITWPGLLSVRSMDSELKVDTSSLEEETEILIIATDGDGNEYPISVVLQP